MIASEPTLRGRTLPALAGLLAGLATVTFTLATRSWRGADATIDLLGDAFLQAVPVSVFTFMLRTFQHVAKPMLLASIILGIIAVGGLIGAISPGVFERSHWLRLPRRVLSMAVAIWIPLAIVVLLTASYGSGGPMGSGRLLRLVAYVAADTLVFAIALHAIAPAVLAFTRRESTRVDVDSPEPDAGRRRLLLAAGGLAVAASTAYVGSFVRAVYSGTDGRMRGTIPEPITPVGQFYVVSKNFVDPGVEVDDWQVELSGLVANRRTLTYDDLLALPSVRQLTTLTCISNYVGGDLISNAEWTGVRLADLLLESGLQPGAVELALYAHDGYTESFELSKALESTTLLAYAMNGEPLTKRHGYPARLIVPGKYGIKNVKWLRRIEVVAGDFRGFWQQRGWTDDGTIETMSRIDVPRSREIVDFGPVEIGGVAFAGDRGISRVEWSADGGRTWTPADRLEEVAPLSWVIWRSTWNPTERGSHRLVVRAIDGTGATQTADRRPPIPDGATGYHSIDVGVA